MKANCWKSPHLFPGSLVIPLCVNGAAGCRWYASRTRKLDDGVQVMREKVPLASSWARKELRLWRVAADLGEILLQCT